ncbi:MAG: 4-hydroxythreonine-4-phosphate dehydrogenase PdxA [Bacteroidetes bacterium]|nr:MAG: 4-hydroxythreonine-4-phosphate dehydrogenase PdxA [Bacteroidota bacterium]
MDKHKIRVGISHGDINGVSYEIIIKALLDHRIFEFCTPIVYGSSKVAAYHRKALNINNFSLNSISKPEDANIKRANIINCVDDNIKVEFGKSTEAAGKSSYAALERATQDLKDSKIDVLLTAPINKNNIQSENFNFPGHTEYLKDKFEAEDVLMMLVSDVMRIGVVTGHVPISKVPEKITEGNILRSLRLMNKSLIEDFRIRKPKIAVLGLNPHAGDNGVIGEEENKIIIPTIAKARNENILAIGPYPADGFFGSNNFKEFDAILAMYHDQGLAPFKAISFDSGVNFTAGLPIVRTSPAHGTAYDIVGKNIASPSSFRQALFLACDIYKNRKEYKNLIKNSIINDSSHK